VLAVHRLVERPNAADLLLLGLGILFSISGGRLGFVFPLILTLVSGVLLLRRRGIVFWWAMIRKSWIWLLAALPPAAVFCQGWLFAYNLQKTGEWAGSPDLPVFAFNAAGILGAAANSVRYLFESVDLTQPIEVVCHWAFGFSPINFLQGLYRITLVPLLDGSGATLPYFIAWMPNNILAWFGPFGIVTVLPAIVYAAWRGPRRLKTIAVALIGYFYLVSLIVGWAPGNAAYFMRLSKHRISAPALANHPSATAGPADAMLPAAGVHPGLQHEQAGRGQPAVPGRPKPSTPNESARGLPARAVSRRQQRLDSQRFRKESMGLRQTALRRQPDPRMGGPDTRRSAGRGGCEK
jgi:hypothetical protein